MLTRKGSVFIAAMAAIFSLLSIVYVSCTKVGSAPACNGVICQNGGYCKSGHCKCPAGYEGSTCGTLSVKRYFGTWNVHQTCIGSDSSSVVGKDSFYTVFLSQTATPTTFFMDNFLGNPNYNNLICTIDTLNPRHFVVDTSRDFHMWYEYVTVKAGSHGDLATDDTTIDVYLVLRRLSPTHNWRNDTMSLIITPHHL